MMKFVLGLSLIVNFVLGYALLTRKPEREVVERVIIETHGTEKPADVQMIDTRNVVQPDISKKKVKKNRDGIDFIPMDSSEMQEVGEKMEAERMEFMTTELGMNEEKIAKHNKIRDEFFRKTSLFWQKNPMRELSFKERREMIQMEEELHTKLEKLHGKKNWEKYEKFREKYNQKGFKKQTEENQPFLFMGL
jgi:hypothetical protein